MQRRWKLKLYVLGITCWSLALVLVWFIGLYALMLNLIGWVLWYVAAYRCNDFPSFTATGTTGENGDSK